MNSDIKDDIMDLVMQCTTLPSHSGFSQQKLVSFVTKIHASSIDFLTPVKMELLLEPTSNKLLVGPHGTKDGDASFQLKSDSLPHAHTQATKTYYKHQDLRIKKAQELKTKTSANSKKQDLPLRYQVYQGRLLESFLDDAKYEHVGPQNGFELRGAVVVDSAVRPQNEQVPPIVLLYLNSVYNEGEKLAKDGSLKKSDSLKQNDRVHLSLSNVEVQINFERLPLWQNAKVHFNVMKFVSVEGFPSEETQIENFLCHEVDIRRKELLPVYEQFNSIKSDWDDR
ncbi:autophagy-related protein 18g-like protein [Tanacetum coccineum]